MFMDKRQLKQAYEKGWLDEVKTQCVRYGKITKDKSWDSNYGDRYDGSHRVYHVEHHGMEWEIHMHNGEVTQVGYKY